MEEGLISVDKWEQSSQAYFLTHLHADHTRGLSRRWKRGPLFCSPITAKLFPSSFPGFDCSLLRVLEIGSRNPLHLTSKTSGAEATVEVTAIDANHCPGSVMYLFQGEFGSFLYTGDFRWESGSELAKLGRANLLNALSGSKLDYVYVDNTYCNPSFYFPSRSTAAQQVADVIASHPMHEIIISINTLGKEDLLLHVAQALKIKIWVWPERLQTMHLLGYEDVFTTDSSLTRVRAVPRYNCTVDTLMALNTTRGPTIGIIPSGLPLGLCSRNKRGKNPRISIDKKQLVDKSSSVREIGPYLYSVPYSDHSCFNEIQDLVQFLQPSHIKGIVSSSFCYVNPRGYFCHLCEGHEQGEDGVAEVMEIGSILGQDESMEIMSTNKRRATLDCGSVKRRRSSEMRREKRGAKLTETDGI